MKKIDPFNYVFILVIIGLLLIPFLWKNYGAEIMNYIIYKEYVESEEVQLINHNASNLDLEYDSDLEGIMYIHLIYGDYEKEIVEFNIIPGNNVININKSKEDLNKVYIYFDDNHDSYKWIIYQR